MLFHSDDVTVYIWPPHGTKVGHASMELPDGTYISWWPANKSSKSKSGFKAVLSTANLSDSLEEDEMTEGANPNEYVIPELNVTAIKAWWKKNSHRKYK